MKFAALPGIAALALAAFAATPARATVYSFTQLPFEAGGLNDLDQIVGEIPYSPITGIDVPEIYDHGTITYPIVAVTGRPITLTAINNAGLVLFEERNIGGEFQIADPLKATYFSIGTYTGLNNKGEIVGPSGPDFGSINGQQLRVYQTGINDADQIVGYVYQLFENGDQGFLLSGGVYTTFMVPGATFTDPVAINNSGEIIGTYTDATGKHGFEEENNVFSTIAGPDGGDFLPSGLNNLGQIVGSTPQGVSYLATPQTVPEPSTLALLCAGLTGLLGWRSWSRR